MNAFATAIVFAIAVSGALDLYLRRRQIGAVRAHRGAPPHALRAAVTLEEHQRAADYTLAAARIGAARSLADTALSILWLTVLLGPLYALSAFLFEPGLTRSVFVALAAAAIGYAVDLPFAILSTFRVEGEFGFNRTTAGTFAADQAKSLGLQLALGVPLLYGLFWLVDALPGSWWLWGWAIAAALAVGLGALYPMWIAPLFNVFRPLPEGPMKARVEALLARCGFQSGGLYVMDASRRSTHGNAYFSGFGRAKRIVFFDTLFEKHDEDEIVSILAHELGHFKLGHIRQRLAQTALILFAVFAGLHLAFAHGLAAAFGLPNDPGVALTIALTAAGPMLRLCAPALNYLSRRAELQADAFARAIVGKTDMINALIRLSRDNLSTLTPDPLYAAFYYSHPPIPIRIAHLDARR